MSTTINQPLTSHDIAPFRPSAMRPDDDRFVELAAGLAAEFATRAAEHDRENTFVGENYDRMKAAGYTRMAIPEELGGSGASMRQTVYAQAALAKGCGSTALGVAMHLYNTLALTYRWRHGADGVGTTLRKIADNNLILMTSGGSDGIYPSATATRTDGGYRISGRKVFCSQVPGADLITTMARYDDPSDGPVVLMMALPVHAPGIEIVETWDTLGMRGTQSHDMVLADVFVADGQISARKAWGRNDAPLRNALVHFAPVVASVYWGIAAGARDEAVRAIAGRGGPGTAPAENPIVQRQVGLMDTRLQTSWWALSGALAELGDDYPLDERTTNAVVVAKREVVTAAKDVVDMAMEITGGGAYFRRSPIERAYRDVRAGEFHPLTPEKTLLHAGRLALGQDVGDIW